MEERDFYNETETTKPATLSCLHCRQTETYEVRWLVRTKKANLARTYMIRRDDVLLCKNPRCRKRFDITGLQSVVFM